MERACRQDHAVELVAFTGDGIKTLSVFLGFLLSLSSLASGAVAETPEESTPFFNGHNLSITSYVLPRGKCAVGLDLLSCGVSETLSVGSSPWMWTDYGMVSLAVRKKMSSQSFLSAYQITYFDTQNNREIQNGFGESQYRSSGLYKMRALWNQFVKTYSPERHYKLHLNFHINYYFDDTLPFSLRRPSFDSSPWQINLTTLHEMHLTRNWYIIGEAGLLDLARSPLHIHSGASIGVLTEKYSVRFGFSLTGSRESLFSTGRRDYQQGLLNQRGDYNDKESLERSGVQNDYALHPEFSLFYVF